MKVTEQQIYREAAEEYKTVSPDVFEETISDYVNAGKLTGCVA